MLLSSDTDGLYSSIVLVLTLSPKFIGLNGTGFFRALRENKEFAISRLTSTTQAE